MSMKYLFPIVFTAVFIIPLARGGEPPMPANGQINQTPSGPMAWNQASEEWLTVEDFWQVFSSANNGTDWGRSKSYPEYSNVGERDTLLIELEQGTCLMYFWHKRWRRAQDVWRWDERFNELLGCPYVFD
jgi:hypothetical protein